MPKEHGHFNRDELRVCPYNPAHTVLQSKMAFHLSRCKNALADQGTKRACPYNVTHIVDETDMGNHMESCPDRGTIDTFKYKVGSTGRASIVPVENRDLPSEENWDDDEDVPTYDPSQRIKENGSLLVQLKCAPPSERKKFREERRILYQTHSVKQEEYGMDGTAVKQEEYGMNSTAPGPSNTRPSSTKPSSYAKQSTTKCEDFSEECGVEPFEDNRPNISVPKQERHPDKSYIGMGRGRGAIPKRNDGWK